MEGELIIVSLITSTFGLIGLFLFNQQWIKRQEIKYKYQLKRAKISKKINAPVREDPGILDQASQWLPLLKNLDGDQISELADKFLGGGGQEIQEAAGGLGDILDNIPPELIDSFLKGAAKKDGAQKENKGFPGQV